MRTNNGRVKTSENKNKLPGGKVRKYHVYLDFLGFEISSVTLFLLLHAQTMSSVCFPAHVVVLFRRIVNVVSTISISNQYVLSTQSGLADDTFHSKTRSASSKQSFAYFRNLEWPWWTQRIDWDGITVVGEDIYGSREIRKAQGLSARDDYGMVLKGAPLATFIMNGRMNPALLQLR